MSYSTTIQLTVGDAHASVEQAIFLTVAFAESEDGPDQFSVAVRTSEYGPNDAEATWHIVESNDGFTMQLTAQTVVETIGKGICLAGCLASIVSGTGPLVACLKKAKKRSQVRECLSKEHAIAQGVGALACIYGCLSL